MTHYSRRGFSDSVIAYGYKGHVLKEYFANYRMHQGNLKVELSSGRIEVFLPPTADWTVTLIETGSGTMTGGRVRRLDRLVDSTFLMKYGYGLSDVPIDAVGRSPGRRQPGIGPRKPRSYVPIRRACGGQRARRCRPLNEGKS